jgi:hypothetical protein
MQVVMAGAMSRDVDCIKQETAAQELGKFSQPASFGCSLARPATIS